MKIKHLIYGALGLTGVGLKAVAQEQKPNILFILIDDMGYPAIECYGNKMVKTPNINSIAEHGVKFTQAYVSPQSTPSRATLLTGQYTANNKMWHVIPEYTCPYARLIEPKYKDNLPREQFTVAEALKEAGYTTAMIGKWHLSTYHNDGYYTYLYADVAKYYGFDYVVPFQDPKEYHQRTEDEAVNILTDEAIGFLERNKTKPFFLYLSHFVMHDKVFAPKELEYKYLDAGYPAKGLNFATYLAAIEHLDNSIGRLMAKLKELGIDKNTVIFFVSDNGGVDSELSNAPLRYGKGTAYEGGTRVPFMVQFPEKYKTNVTCTTPIHAIDVYPTLLEIANAPQPTNQKLDGVSILPLVEKNPTSKHKFAKRPIYMYAPLYDQLWGSTPSATMVDGDYKVLWFFGDYVDRENNNTYIPEGRVELYNLKKDIGEKQDLSKTHKLRTKRMQAKLKAWILSTGCSIPELNPNYDYEKRNIRVDGE